VEKNIYDLVLMEVKLPGMSEKDMLVSEGGFQL